MRDGDGRRRVIIEGVNPEIDCGRFPIKRIVGEEVVVEADIFTDGHDAISCALLYRPEDDPDWREVPMEYLVNDRWRAKFTVNRVGRYRYTLMAWLDPFQSWRRDLQKRVEAGQEVSVELLSGAELVRSAAGRASPADQPALDAAVGDLSRDWHNSPARIRRALDEELARLMARYPDREFATSYDRELEVVVDRERAGFSAWYELFPRSASPEPGRHGTFKDVEARLPYVASMGFDVLYLPPIHPIGMSFRKGRNNNPRSAPGEPGSPWGIGSQEGGHKAIHSELGTLEEFRGLVARAREFGMEVALDIAFQTSPDHPYVKEHPEWFRWRPNGTVQYAENPPKKYQDIYPFEFNTPQWRELWEELKSVFDFWIEQGVRIFRVDNPHTKPFPFWEWCIGEIKAEHPGVIFLAEAFTRPKVMYRLAKLGFTQSYTYFAWRNARWEITEYLTELTRTEVREYFRPNFWPNTPDILHESLQHGGTPAFKARLALAATLSSNYGIYGPAFELQVSQPRERGSEEYLNSEKYEVKHWDLDRPDSLRDFISQVNRIRRDNPALHDNGTLEFHPVDNDRLIAYSKHSPDFCNLLIMVVNLDSHWTQSGWLDLPLDRLGIDAYQPYEVHDLLTGAVYRWQGSRNYVELRPQESPVHIFRVRSGFCPGGRTGGGPAEETHRHAVE